MVVPWTVDSHVAAAKQPIVLRNPYLLDPDETTDQLFAVERQYHGGPPGVPRYGTKGTKSIAADMPASDP